MACRYLALVAYEAPAIARMPRAAAAVAARFPELVRVRESSGLSILADASPAPLLDPAQGIILGQVFTMGHRGALDALWQGAPARIVASGGQHLIDAFWGGYVAILTPSDARQVAIVRAPLGDLPCYQAQAGGITMMASDTALLLASGLIEPAIAWPALARQLLAGDMRLSETCLEGVRELRGGERLTIGPDGAKLETLWSPWTFAARPIADRAEAVRRVRDAVHASVAAHGADASRVLLKLSGGLDSSIVAAALRHTGVPFSCLTLVTEAATGDERPYARQVTAHLGVDLIEAYRDASAVDPLCSAAAHLPRPSVRSFVQESERACRTAAARTDADLLMDGGGGDNVFNALQSAAPVADCLLTGDPEARFWRCAGDMARLTDTSVLKVARRAADRAWRRGPAYRWPIDRRFLSREAQREVDAAVAHPWLAPPQGALPGRAAHIALIIAGQSYVEALDPEAAPPVAAPLLAQPVVETCLRVPSWLWFENGCNRAVARRAFADALPAEIVWRRSKGTPESFMAQIYERDRSAIRDALLGGALNAAGLLDRAALAAELDDPRPVRGIAFIRVLQLVDAEAWARAWIERAQEVRPSAALRVGA